MKDQSRVAITTLVKNLIGRKSETKYISGKLEVNVPHNSPIGAGDIRRIMPGLVQGTSDANRLGDSVKPISLRVRGLVTLNRTAINSNQVLLVRVIVAQYKSARSNPALQSATSTIAGSLLKPNYEDSGSGIVATKTFDGSQLDLMTPLNKEMFTVYYDKIHRLAGSSENGMEEQPESYFRWSVEIPTPATLNYDDGTSGASPTNFAPFMALGYAYADGQGPDVLATKILSTAQSELKFKDF